MTIKTAAIELPFLRTAYNYDRMQVSNETGLDCTGDKGATHQSFKDECDINTIVRQFGLTGELPQGVHMPTYQDFDDVFDFQSACNVIVEAQAAFMAMPAEVRARFGNDPQEFLEFTAKPENRDEAIKLGLVIAERNQAQGPTPGNQEPGNQAGGVAEATPKE